MSQFAHLKNGDFQGICEDHMMYVKQWIHGMCWSANTPSLPSFLPFFFFKRSPLSRSQILIALGC